MSKLTSTSDTICIIGAGPGGISMAVEAINAGIPASSIIVLEQSPEHSFSIRKYYPDKKLVAANYKGNAGVCHGVMCISDSSKQEYLSLIDQIILQHKIPVHYNESVHSIKKCDGGDFEITTNKEVYKAKVCVVAIGIFGRPNKPDYRIPADCKDKVHFDITTKPITDSHVLVVGGGDSASEYCQYLIESNNRVELSYRKDKFTRMNSINLDSLMALEEKKQVSLLKSSNIEGLMGQEGKVVAQFSETQLGERAYDCIVYALGGSTPQNFLKTAKIEFTNMDSLAEDDFETNVDGLYLIGDLSSGKRGGSIITAFNSAHAAMRGICEKHFNCPFPPAPNL